MPGASTSGNTFLSAPLHFRRCPRGSGSRLRPLNTLRKPLPGRPTPRRVVIAGPRTAASFSFFSNAPGRRVTARSPKSSAPRVPLSRSFQSCSGRRGPTSKRKGCATSGSASGATEPGPASGWWRRGPLTSSTLGIEKPTNPLSSVLVPSTRGPCWRSGASSPLFQTSSLRASWVSPRVLSIRDSTSSGGMQPQMEAQAPLGLRPGLRPGLRLALAPPSPLVATLPARIPFRHGTPRRHRQPTQTP